MAVVRDGSAAAIVELRCETDFVAKSEEFVSLVDEMAARVAAEGEGAVDAFTGRLETLLTTLKENISVGRVVRLVAGAGQVVETYLHQQAGRGVNAVAVVAEGVSEETAHDVAVHIAFARPEYLSRDDVPAAEVAAERDVIEAMSRNEGKPEAALPKIVEGRLNGWFKERVLLEQPFARDDKQTVAAGPQGRAASWPSPRWSWQARRVRRVVLKLSGEALASAASDETIDASTVDFLAHEIAKAMDVGDLELAVVVGGGNIWRGATGAMAGMNRANSDLMGMLGTVINALALQDAIESQGRPTRVHVGHRDGPGLRALHPPARGAPPREGPGRHLRGRHGQPLLHDRHPGGPARRRDRGRRRAQGHPRRGRRGLHRGPAGLDQRRALRGDLLRRGHRPGTCASWT